MLVDGDPIHRLHRVENLLRSDVDLEVEVGAREQAAIVARLAPVVLSAASLPDLFYAAARSAPPLRPSALPDTDWLPHFAVGLGRLVVSRRLRGRVLVVRESGGRSGWFYVVVDGIHTSGLPGVPWAYRSLEQAMRVAEDITRGRPPKPVPGIMSCSGYFDPGPTWSPIR